MINFNGNIVNESDQLSKNRGFLFGDAVFESFRLISGTIIFWEDHYFRLMASMRILRFDIPENFTALNDFIAKLSNLKLVEVNSLKTRLDLASKNLFGIILIK